MSTVMNSTKTKFTPPSNRTESLEQTQTCFQKHQKRNISESVNDVKYKNQTQKTIIYYENQMLVFRMDQEHTVGTLSSYSLKYILKKI